MPPSNNFSFNRETNQIAATIFFSVRNTLVHKKNSELSDRR